MPKYIAQKSFYWSQFLWVIIKLLFQHKPQFQPKYEKHKALCDPPISLIFFQSPSAVLNRKTIEFLPHSEARLGTRRTRLTRLRWSRRPVSLPLLFTLPVANIPGAPVKDLIRCLPGFYRDSTTPKIHVDIWNACGTSLRTWKIFCFFHNVPHQQVSLGELPIIPTSLWWRPHQLAAVVTREANSQQTLVALNQDEASDWKRDMIQIFSVMIYWVYPLLLP